jgi:uncharacterized protein YecT (DUF1311 family)
MSGVFMQFTTIVFFILISMSVSGFAAASKVCADPQSQHEINRCSYERAKQADRELNRIYKLVIKKHSKDKVFIQNLRKAQRAWVKFRDAEMDALYPARKPGYYGSMMPACKQGVLRTLTEQRTAQLKRWLRQKGEVDPCESTIAPSNN